MKLNRDIIIKAGLELNNAPRVQNFFGKWYMILVPLSQKAGETINGLLFISGNALDETDYFGETKEPEKGPGEEISKEEKPKRGKKA